MLTHVDAPQPTLRKRFLTDLCPPPVHVEAPAPPTPTPSGFVVPPRAARRAGGGGGAGGGAGAASGAQPADQLAKHRSPLATPSATPTQTARPHVSTNTTASARSKPPTPGGAYTPGGSRQLTRSPVLGQPAAGGTAASSSSSNRLSSSQPPPPSHSPPRRLRSRGRDSMQAAMHVPAAVPASSSTGSSGGFYAVSPGTQPSPKMMATEPSPVAQEMMRHRQGRPRPSERRLPASLDHPDVQSTPPQERQMLPAHVRVAKGVEFKPSPLSAAGGGASGRRPRTTDSPAGGGGGGSGRGRPRAGRRGPGRHAGAPKETSSSTTAAGASVVAAVAAGVREGLGDAGTLSRRRLMSSKSEMDLLEAAASSGAGGGSRGQGSATYGAGAEDEAPSGRATDRGARGRRPRRKQYGGSQSARAPTYEVARSGAVSPASSARNAALAAARDAAAREASAAAAAAAATTSSAPRASASSNNLGSPAPQASYRQQQQRHREEYERSR